MTPFFRSFLGAAIASFVALSCAHAQTVTTQPQTITIPAYTVTVTVPAKTIVIPGQTNPVAGPVITPPPPPPPPPPPVTGTTFTVYANGVFHWQGDYSWGNPISITYNDTSGAPVVGPFDIKVAGYGGFQPYAQGNNFDTTPYKYLMFDLKPTVNGQLWDTGFEAVGDVPVGVLIDVLKYGPAPVAGKWATYKIPLGVGGYLIPVGSHIYKFMVQDQNTGGTANVWYVDNISFTN